MTQPIKAEPIKSTLKIKRSNLNLYEDNKEFEILKNDLSKLRTDLYGEIDLLKAKIQQLEKTQEQQNLIPGKVYQQIIPKSNLAKSEIS